MRTGNNKDEGERETHSNGRGVEVSGARLGRIGAQDILELVLQV